jgi:hypothetical protein
LLRRVRVEAQQVEAELRQLRSTMTQRLGSTPNECGGTILP